MPQRSMPEGRGPRVHARTARSRRMCEGAPSNPRTTAVRPSLGALTWHRRHLPRPPHPAVGTSRFAPVPSRDFEL